MSERNDTLNELKIEVQRLSKEARDFKALLDARGHESYATKVFGRAEGYATVLSKITRMQRKENA